MARQLIIKLGALGDVVMATALIRRLQQDSPDARFSLLTTPAFAPLFQDWPDLEVQAVPRKGMANMLRALRWVRRQGFERVYDLQSSDRSGVLVALSGIPERVGNHPRFPYTHHPPTPYRGEVHIFERMNQVLASAGIAPAEPRPWLPASEAECERVHTWLRERGLAGARLALFHAGASERWPSKCWPHFGVLAERLEAGGVRVVWLGAGHDAARNRELSQRAGIDATDAFGIRELAELGRHAAFAVTNDSGPMHVLSAAGIPIYAFFGPTNWRRNHALGQAGRVLTHPVDCSPCSLGVCPPERGHACLAGVTPEAVLARLTSDGLIDGVDGRGRDSAL